MLPALARDAADDLLARLDLALPGRIDGLYIVGSACLGAFRAGRSDLDIVAVLTGDLARDELRQLRRVHLRGWASALARDAVLGRRWPLVCNGVYVQPGDLARSSLEVTPVASHVAGRFSVGEGFDVNPVTWHTLAHRGITIRGPQPDRLGIYTNDAQLRAWTLGNLNGYWRSWVADTRHHGWVATRALWRRFATWGVLGAPRLHYTVVTGAITSKENAASYALDAFDPCWHPLIEDALAYWRGTPAQHPYRRQPARRRRDTADFVDYVVEAANGTLTRRLVP